MVYEWCRSKSTVHDAFRATLVTMAANESGRRSERLDLRALYPFVEEWAFRPDC